MSASPPKPTLPFKPRISGPERRARIEAEAARLFAERGYEATSLEEVAAAAGVSRAVVYDHFASKRDLHEQLLRREGRGLLEFIAARAAGAVEPGERFRLGVTAFFEYVKAHPYAWRMIIRDPPVDAKLARLQRTMQDRATETLAAILASDPVAAADSKRDPERWMRLAQGLKWATNGLATWWYDHPEAPVEVLVESAMDLCWRGLERTREAATGESAGR
ncbi:MAG: TetR/AcrR family transcriptional regulator [Solirubrobacterales bacterium]